MYPVILDYAKTDCLKKNNNKKDKETKPQHCPQQQHTHTHKLGDCEEHWDTFRVTDPWHSKTRLTLSKYTSSRYTWFHFRLLFSISHWVLLNILDKIKDCFFSCIFISMTSLLKHWWHFSQWFKWGAYHTCHLQFLQLLPVLKAFPVLVWPSGQLAMGDRNGWTWSRLALPARTWWQPHDVAPRAVGSTIPTTPLGRSTGVLWLSPVVALGCPGTCTSWSQVSLLASARWPSCLGVVRQEGFASLPLGGRPDPGWSSWTGISNLGGPVCTAEVPEKS